MANYVYKDITHILFNIYPHSPQILKKLDKYNVGVNLSYKPLLDSPVRSKSHKKSKDNKPKRKVRFCKTINYAEERKESVESSHKKGENQNIKSFDDKSK